MTRSWGQLLHTALNMFKVKKFFNSPLARKVTVPRFSFQPMELRLIMRRAPTLLGWPGMAGIGVLTACAAFYLSTILQAEKQLASLHHRVLTVQDQLKHGDQGSHSSQRTPEEQLAKFYSLFPQHDDLPQRMEKIFSSAQSHGIGLEQGEYKVTRESEGGLVRFQMTFPVKGDYPRIRKYLSSLMTDIPTLALQQVQFKREKVGDATVDADIKLVLYLLEQRS